MYKNVLTSRSRNKITKFTSPVEPTLSMAVQELRIDFEHSELAAWKSDVTILEKTSQGVMSVNCKIGAEAAIALKIKIPSLLEKEKKLSDY